jgi:hypothetical protein
MKKSIFERNLRLFIREVLSERSPGPVVSVDPTNLDTSPSGFYPYEIERGTDIQGFWYKSPGRTAGADGDPGRPSDAEEYIGIKPKTGGEAGGAPTPTQ